MLSFIIFSASLIVSENFLRDWEVALQAFHDSGYTVPVLSDVNCLTPHVFACMTGITPIPDDPVEEDQSRILSSIDSAAVSHRHGILPPDLLPHGPCDPPDPATVIKSQHGWSLGVHKDGTVEQRQAVDELVARHENAFSRGLHDLPGYTGRAGDFNITPPGTALAPLERPLTRKARRWTTREEEASDTQLQPLADNGIIVPCNDNTFATNLVIAPKKDSEGRWLLTRVAVDWRWVNRITPTDAYPIPLPDRMFQDIGDATHFSKLDMRQGFLQCKIPEHLQHVTAFYWKGKLFQYTRCGYGMKNSPSHFQRVMDTTLADATTRIRVRKTAQSPQDPSVTPAVDSWEWQTVPLSQVARAYIDDILISSNSYEEHCIHIESVLVALHNSGLRAHPEKSLFNCSVLEYLGHDISRYGLTPSQVKVQAIRSLPTPNSVESLRRVLGFSGYYRTYVPFYSDISKPLTELLCKGAAWDWKTNPNRDSAWEALKAALCKPGNALKRADPTRPFLLHTDWSKAGLSAVLGQLDDNGNEYLVACLSRSNSKSERNYGSYRGEMLAAVWGIRSFRHYLHGSPHPFKLFTDHKGLQWLMTTPELDGQYARWACLISDFNFTIHYKPGALHAVADAPSRGPDPSTVDRTGSREPLHEDYTARFSSIAATAVVDNSDFLFSPHGLASFMTITDEYEQDIFDQEPSMLPVTLTESNSASALDMATFNAHEDALQTLMFPLSIKSDVPSDQIQTYEPYAATDSHLAYAEPYSGQACIFQSLLANMVSPSPLDSYSFADELQLPWDFTDPSEITTPHPLTAPHLLDLVALHAFSSPPPEPIPSLQLDKSSPVPGLDPSPVPLSQLSDLHDIGVTAVELFGGISAGLEMLLRSNIPVRRYIYCDNSPMSQLASRHRCAQMTQLYPALFPLSAWQSAYTTLPQDVYHISPQHLIDILPDHPGQWFVIAGFECQDLSPAGSGAGLSGHRSSTFYPLLSILHALQNLQPSRPPLYLIENTAMTAVSSVRPLVQLAYNEICSKIGNPVLLDAARVNSYAHRLRNYWTNLVHPTTLQAVLDSIDRHPGLALSDILDPDHRVPLCRQVNSSPWYPVNILHQPRAVLPTFVATVQSYAFRLHSGGTGAGLILDACGHSCDLSLREREQAMGYSPFLSSLSPSVFSFTECHGFLGRAFDINAVSALLATSLSIRLCQPSISTLGGDDLRHSEDDVNPTFLAAMATAANIQDSSHQSLQDAWDDLHLLTFLQLQTMPQHIDRKEKDRIRKRASGYVWLEDKLFRKFTDFSVKEVPHPSKRTGLIRQIHESLGHFGHRRTSHQVLLSHWWPNLYHDVRSVCRSCEACDRSHATFNAMQPVLQPLPIKGLFYRWGMDLAGPFPTSDRGNTYILVCIEHFSKWVEVFPLQNKTASEVAYYAKQLFSRYLAPAEVVTDGGGEFEGAFHDLLVEMLIDHRVTSSNHPQANGLAERAVGTFKICIKRHVSADPAAAKNWDLYLPSIVMGYVVSPQASSKLSPYEALFAVAPIIPPAIRERLQHPIDFDDPQLAAQSILQRAAVLKQSIPIAGQNLDIAQKRDTLRYARLRSAGYLPSIARFTVGQYVYLSRTRLKAAGWSLAAKQDAILRVTEVRPSGTLLLSGQCGHSIVENAINCSPCHLPILATAPVLARPLKDHPCAICHLPDRPTTMLLCDHCNKGFHLECLTPPLKKVPKGDWFCLSCSHIDHGTSSSQSTPAVPTGVQTIHKKAGPASETQIEVPSAPSPRRSSSRLARML